MTGASTTSIVQRAPLPPAGRRAGRERRSCRDPARRGASSRRTRRHPRRRARAGARAEACRRGTARRSDPHAGAPRGRGGRRRVYGERSPGSGRGGCAGRRPSRKAVGHGCPTGVRLRIDADDLDPTSPQLHVDRLVAEQHHTREPLDRRRVDALRERIAAVREVVVAENDVAAAELSEQAFQLGHPRAARDEIAGDADEVGLALAHPVDGVLHRAPAA